MIAVVAGRVVSRETLGHGVDELDPSAPPPMSSVPGRYLEALRRAGGIAVSITPGSLPADAVGQVVQRVDGVLLIGGGDVSPQRYGAQPAPQVFGVEPDRDELEIAMVHAAIAAGRPLLGVCRGMQLLNVALGGTLVQHLHDDPQGTRHRSDTPGVPLAHGIDLEPTSVLGTVLGASVTGLSGHHQAVDAVAPSLRACGWADDGIVEMVESTTGWTVGVQWHPESDARDSAASQRVYDTFVAACRPGG